MTNPKPWYASKLTWLGIITSAIGILQVVGEWISANSFQPEDFTILVVGILTVILRVWFTDTPIETKGR